MIISVTNTICLPTLHSNTHLHVHGRRHGVGDHHAVHNLRMVGPRKVKVSQVAAAVALDTAHAMYPRNDVCVHAHAMLLHSAALGVHIMHNNLWALKEHVTQQAQPLLRCKGRHRLQTTVQRGASHDVHTVRATNPSCDIAVE